MSWCDHLSSGPHSPKGFCHRPTQISSRGSSPGQATEVASSLRWPRLTNALFPFRLDREVLQQARGSCRFGRHRTVTAFRLGFESASISNAVYATNKSADADTDRSAISVTALLHVRGYGFGCALLHSFHAIYAKPQAATTMSTPILQAMLGAPRRVCALEMRSAGHCVDVRVTGSRNCVCGVYQGRRTNLRGLPSSSP